LKSQLAFMMAMFVWLALVVAPARGQTFESTCPSAPGVQCSGWSDATAWQLEKARMGWRRAQREILRRHGVDIPNHCDIEEATVEVGQHRATIRMRCNMEAMKWRRPGE
jgi:hypothetical protein